MGETFYDVLEVGADASQAEIEAAYRERVKETHPDLNDAPDASDAFQRVQAAEEVLGDPEERARYDRLGHASYASHVGAAEGGSGWEAGADDDFGFDPGAYDRTRDGTTSGRSNASQRSYDVSGGPDGAPSDGSSTGGGSASAGATGTTAGAAGATAGASGATATGGGESASANEANGFGDPSDGRHWRERERERSKAAQREGRGTVDDDEPAGYSVHDWDDEDLDTARTPYRLQGSEAVVVGIMFVLYPFVAFSAITPQFSLGVNLTVAFCGLLLTGYLLTMPRIAIYVFGAWSVIAPLSFLAFPALDVVSLLGVVVLAATWIPFGYSVLFMQVLR